MSMHVSYGTTVTGHMYMYTEIISITLSTSDLVNIVVSVIQRHLYIHIGRVNVVCSVFLTATIQHKHSNYICMLLNAPLVFQF